MAWEVESLFLHETERDTKVTVTRNKKNDLFIWKGVWDFKWNVYKIK